MKDTGINEKVITQICSLAKADGIDKVILFGSRARSDYGRSSDIDLAVTGGDADSFHYDLENNTDTLLTYDVVSLDNSVAESLRDSIAREGICLYEKV